MRRRITVYLSVVAVAVGTAAFATVGAAVAAWLSTSPPVTAHAGAATMPAGGQPTATADAASVTVSWPGSSVAGHPVSGYRISRDGQPATGGCAGVLTATTCTEAGVPDGTWRYTVAPVQGSHWTGPDGPQGTVTVSTVDITFPVAGQTYGISGYNAGCATSGGDFCGTAAGAQPFTVKLSVRRVDTGDWWNPSDNLFDSATEKTHQVGNPANWSLAFPVSRFPAAGRYTLKVLVTDRTGRASTASATFTVYPQAPPAPAITSGPADPTNQTTATFTFADSQSGVDLSCSLDGAAYAACPGSPATVGPLAAGRHRYQIRATDAGGNTSAVAGYSWTVDLTAPRATDIQAGNGSGGTAGRIEAGDTLRYSFSEAVAPGSVLPGWDGTPKSVTVTFDAGTQSLSVDGTALGTVALGQPGYVLSGTTATATIATAGSDIVLTFTAVDPAAFGTVTAPGTMTWQPGAVRDPAGNALSNAGTDVTERHPGGLDTEF